ncbi:MAG TPA: hypothetical protein VG056_06000, partial [Pirellulales bacterium]|nr:hypothetical protein [Pirellulales bacterium]
MTIVPKGLRSFDANDARFFLQLLPGPFDEKGLPETIRFWKYRIETTDELTFTVGVIYGPSGCGKSSLVKAGLIPSLDQRIVSVYVEATADDTEVRLLAALRRRLPNLPQDLDLTRTIAALRRGTGLTKKQKVIIVLDQFEQWLHAKRVEENTELAQALRQCDGERVQCVLLVRDDFWLAISRFMVDLNIVLVQGQNLALVDLFDMPHARKVLAAFGAAYGRLQETLAPEQESFLDLAVRGLAQDARVICVRLTLFAEMVKDKPWSPETLNKVGGIEGVGTTFLEETFSATTAGPKRRYHQSAARAVLKALLPAEGTDIRGQMRPLGALLSASGYQDRPQDFSELMRMLDSELRLITPTYHLATDAESESDDASPASGESHRYYQLTHDYLVPALREWLNRKQRESRRGRAGLLIESRASMWKIKHENRFLPTPREYLVIRTLTNQQDWTDVQRQMMGRAGQMHLRNGAVLLGMLIVLALTGFFAVRPAIDSQRAEALVHTLLNDDITKVRETIADLRPYHRWADPLLQQAYADGNLLDRERANAALALPVDSGRLKYLLDRLLASDAVTFPALRDLLSDYRNELISPLWQTLQDDRAPPSARFQAACALASYTRDDPAAAANWKKPAPFVADYMVTTLEQNYGEFNLIVDALRPARKHLVEALTAIFREPGRADSQHSLVTSILSDYAKDSPDRLAALVADADPKSFKLLFNSLSSNRAVAVGSMSKELERSPPIKSIEYEGPATRLANSAVALYLLGQSEKVWPLLKKSPDPRVRSFIIHRIYQFGGDPKLLFERFAKEEDPSVRQAILLALGEFTDLQVPQATRSAFVEKLATLYREQSDPGLHGAIEWLLRTWREGDLIKQLNDSLAGQAATGRSWYINHAGQTIVIVRGPIHFQIGSPSNEPNRDGGRDGKIEQQH